MSLPVESQWILQMFILWGMETTTLFPVFPREGGVCLEFEIKKIEFRTPNIKVWLGGGKILPAHHNRFRSSGPFFSSHFQPV